MIRAAIAVLLAVAGLTSCRLAGGGAFDSTPDAALVEWHENLYVLGGRDETGKPRSEVWRVSVASDGSLGPWARDTDLPLPLAGAGASAFGGKVYIFGGDTDLEETKSVYSALVNADGTLGYSTGWVENPVSLPEPLSGASIAVLDGRVVLLGGSGSLGDRKTVYHARFWNDGSVGQWYQSPDLPEPASGLWAAPSEGKLWVGDVGGRARFVALLDDGLPGTWVKTEQMAPLPAGYVLARGKAWSVLSIHGSAPPRLEHTSVAAWTAPPEVSPGSGFVKQGRRPVVTGSAGATIRYESAGYNETPADPRNDGSSPLWDPAMPVAVTTSQSYAFRSFGPEGASETRVVRYRILSTGLFSLLQATLGPGVTHKGALVETYSDGSTKPVTSVTFRLVISSRTELSFHFDDLRSLPDLTAQVEFTVFEEDGYTVARSASGAEMLALAPGSYAAILGEGRYQVVAKGIGGAEGGSFRLGTKVP